MRQALPGEILVATVLCLNNLLSKGLGYRARRVGTERHGDLTGRCYHCYPLYFFSLNQIENITATTAEKINGIVQNVCHWSSVGSLVPMIELKIQPAARVPRP